MAPDLANMSAHPGFTYIGKPRNDGTHHTNVRLYSCDRCGVVVTDQALHEHWHNDYGNLSIRIVELVGKMITEAINELRISVARDAEDEAT